MGHTAAAEELDVAVVGGGPAGLAAAVALLRTCPPGTRLQVFEAGAGYSASQGAAVGLFMNGVKALGALEPTLPHRLISEAVLFSHWRDYDDVSGELLPGSMPLDRAGGLRTTGYTPCHVQWSTLRGALYELLPPGTVQFGCKVVGCEEVTAAATPGDGSSDGGSGSVGGAYQLRMVRRRRSADGEAAGQERQQKQKQGLQDQEDQEEEEEEEVVVVVRARHVVAADGYFSRVRRTGGDGGKPIFRGKVRWFGSLTTAELLAAVESSSAAAAAAGGEQGSKQQEQERQGALRLRLPDCLDASRNPDGMRSVHRWMPGGPNRVLDVQAAPRGFVFYPISLPTTGPGGSRLVWSMYADMPVLAAAGVDFPPPPAPSSAADEGASSSGSSSSSGAAAVAAAAEEAANDAHGAHVGGARARGEAALQRALAVAAGYGLPEDVRSIAAATPPERVSEFGMYQHTPEMATPGAWARGRLVHVGDAAHAGPPDGTGANFALEDAAVLGACVRRHGLGPEAFAAWEAARMPRLVDHLYNKAIPPMEKWARMQNTEFEPLWRPEQVLEAAADQQRACVHLHPPAEVAEAAARAVALGDDAGATEAIRKWAWSALREAVVAKAVDAGVIASPADVEPAAAAAAAAPTAAAAAATHQPAAAVGAGGSAKPASS
ncbi:hypothetical protein HYH02_008308 [Chlamydomonas schloesseri]|uniref:FAD-binding domain-containing protein n=1 Tax=Chlamydomonas schloesseri TaxID=2026947 RepID=A0A835WG02_9CHLO|nr:hypothetical protein HYH02_008308 [Chlamydomonas schloesseri]|eukprot:KAG2446747.1 hypothetical protein HYH02_008308 [Chlamydomonas schloesseri]